MYIGNASSKSLDAKVVIIGGGASGVSAGITCARLGIETLILEESSWLGGMLTSAGVSAIDGNYKLPSGFFGEFRDSIAAHYGGLDSLKTGWVSHVLFEPSVGAAILKKMASKEPFLTVEYNMSLLDVKRIRGEWEVVYRNTLGDRKAIYPKIIIDATELGDVAKHVGIGYDIGMESNKITNESIAPNKSNHIVQDLTYVAILKDFKRDVKIEKPENYNPALFACSCSNKYCVDPKEPDRLWGPNDLITYGKLPNNKYMINWPIEGNDYYLNLIELTSEERLIELEKAKKHTLNFVYFIQHELGFNTIGIADDEFPTKDGLPFIPYHRESRRVHGEVRFTLNHITDPFTQAEPLYRTNIAVGDYPVDHHHTKYEGYENLPNLYFHPVPSFGLPLGTMLPKEVDGFIVAEKSISVSNIVNGTTRLQPVVLQIGQAAGVVAALSMKNGIEVRDVNVRDVQKIILAQGGYLMPYLDVERGNPLFLPLQRIGVTGLIRGEGRTVEWSNETWMRIDDPLRMCELSGFIAYYSYLDDLIDLQSEKELTLDSFINILRTIAKRENSIIDTSLSNVNKILQQFDLKSLKNGDIVERAVAVVLLDQLLDPFNTIQVDIQGNKIHKTI